MGQRSRTRGVSRAKKSGRTGGKRAIGARGGARTGVRRSVCPVACTLDLVGDRWTLLVVRDMLLGRSRFHEFLAAPERIASNILSDRLERLVTSGVAETFASPDRADQYAYRLTMRGRALRPVLESIADWGLKNIPGSEIRLQSRQEHGAAKDAG